MSEEVASSVLDEVMGSTDVNDIESAVIDANESAESGSSGGISKEAFSQLSKSVEGLQSLIGKWGNERGTERSELQELKALLTQQNQPRDGETNGQGSDVWGKLMEDPEGTIANLVMKTVSSQNTQQQNAQNQVRETLKNIAPDFDEHHEDIVAMIAKDSGATKQQIASQLPNFGTATLFNVYKRVQAEKKLAEVDKLLGALKNQNVDWEQAKRALSKSHSSGDSFNPPSSASAPVIDPFTLGEEARKKLMAQRGIKLVT